MNDLKTVREALEGVRNCYKTHSKISSGLWDCEIKPAIAILDRMIETPAPQGWKLVPIEVVKEINRLSKMHSVEEYKEKEDYCVDVENMANTFMDAYDMFVRDVRFINKKIISAAPTPAPTDCQHEIIDIRNEVIQSGYMCKKCNALFKAGDHSAPIEKEEQIEGLEMALECETVEHGIICFELYKKYPLDIIRDAAKAQLKRQLQAKKD